MLLRGLSQALLLVERPLPANLNLRKRSSSPRDCNKDNVPKEVDSKNGQCNKNCFIRITWLEMRFVLRSQLRMGPSLYLL